MSGADINRSSSCCSCCSSKNNIKKLGVGVIGLGCRGYSMTKLILSMPDIEVRAVCDVYEDRIGRMVEYIRENAADDCKEVYTSTDYRQIIGHPEVEAVLVFTSWDAHIEICIAAMNAGKYVASEVGGAYCLEQCWELVRTYERTRVPVMMLENCCYGKNEMMILGMIRKGLFGEVVHCAGGYRHDLRDEVALGHENRHYRLDNYMHRNGELYPTHELGPIAKYLHINRGNRMLMLTSMSSKARGVHDWIARNRGAEFENADYNFAEGDIVTTCIKCAGGETIVLTHDTTLPRAYSRGNLVAGTRGAWSDDNGGILLDGMATGGSWSHKFTPVSEFYDEHMHPLWKEYIKGGINGGHGGIDYLVLRGFFEAAINKTPVPIDVYDMASWMAITCLSEDSVAMGSMPVAIPDFTAGKWLHREPLHRSKYCVEEVCEEFFDTFS